MVCLTLSAAIPSLRPPPCPSNNKTGCQAASGYQIGVLHVGLYLIAFGNGGIKPNVSTLGADQFDDSDPNERKHMSNFFNWFYFIISIGSLLSVTVFVYIQVNKNSTWFSFICIKFYPDRAHMSQISCLSPKEKPMSR